MKKTKMEIYQEEQILLAKERTILSFMRTGLAFIAAGVVIISVLKQTATQIVGYGLLLFGIYEVIESFRRLKRKQREMDSLKKELKGAK